MGEDEARMVKAKRKSKAKQPRKAGKKAKAIKVLKKKKARPAPKARAHARKLAKGKLARPAPGKAPKAAAHPKPQGKAPTPPRIDGKAKKPTIKSAKAALEQLEAKLAEGAKTKAARGRVVPELARLHIREYRELVVAPYRLVYRITPGEVLVLAVFDGRRNLEDALLDRLVRPGEGEE